MDITEKIGWWLFYDLGCNGSYESKNSVVFEADPGHNDRGSFTRAPDMAKGRWVATNGILLLKLNPPDTLTMTGQIAGLTVTGIYSNFESDSLGCIYMRRKDVKMPEE